RVAAAWPAPTRPARACRRASPLAGCNRRSPRGAPPGATPPRRTGPRSGGRSTRSYACNRASSWVTSGLDQVAHQPIAPRAAQPLPARPPHPRLGRREARAGQRRDLVDRVTLEHVQHERDALLRADRLEVVVELLHAPARVDLVIAVRGAGVGDLFERRQFAA